MRDFLDRASEAYYEGRPFVSDATYDILFAIYGGSQVGHSITNGTPHFYRMHSLQKCYDLDLAPIELDQCFISPKFDGAAVSALYVEGKLTMGLTRGDGNLGQDITEKVKLLVPQSLPTSETLQITGEVVAPLTIENSRNYAAGSLHLKNMSEFSKRLPNLTFVAYASEPQITTFYDDCLHRLNSFGFTTVDEPGLDDIYPTDGKVYRLISNAAYDRAGHTSHHPRGAFAFKINSSGEITKLIGVTWQVGRTGVISPVALLEPVNINGANVSRASLHNAAHIEKLNLEIGCNVEVVRSGEIIPQIVRRVP